MKQLINLILAMSISALTFAQNNLSSGLREANFDRSVKPSTDFYQFACGGWMAANPLPQAYSRYGMFDILQRNNQQRINDILTELEHGSYANGTIEQKLSDLYKLAMDSTRLNEAGTSTIMPTIKAMRQAKTTEQLKNIQLGMPFQLPGHIFSFYFMADAKSVDENILNVSQGGLTLAQKEYYLNSDSATVAIRNAYKDYIVRMMQLFDYTEEQAKSLMQNVMEVETSLAVISKSRTELRDVEANYNKVTIYDFERDYPNVSLRRYLNAQGVDDKYFEYLIVGQPAFFTGLNTLLGSLPTDALRDYMIWHYVSSATPYLSDEVRAVRFDFFGRVMRGQKEDHPRWKRATDIVESCLGQALGRMYVERYFSPEAKARMSQLVENLRVSLGQRIDAQAWMSDETKRNAHAKLDAFAVKIGYPDEWRDYSPLTIDPNLSLYENIMACDEADQRDELNRTLGKPVDRKRWYMTPQTVNAYYNPTTNEICFPAGILQYPFFDMQADDAFNYGGIGTVIGHEMTHGFDDQGSHFDSRGNMNDWWTADDRKNFDHRGDGYADFFSSIEVLPGLKGNGRLTLGENLADHGGLMVSFNAFKNATKAAPLSKKDGFTPEQRFFLAYAGLWAQNITDAEIRSRVLNDPHSLGRWRVNGALMHIDTFYKAFNIKAGSPMFLPKADRLDLW